MFSIDNVVCHVGGRLILNHISFRVGDGERVVVVGANGTGKSTLLKTAAGLITPSEGGVSMAKDSKVGYLPQDPRLDSERTLRDELLSVFQSAHDYFAELERLEHRMAEAVDAAELDRIGHRYEFLHSELHRMDAYNLESKVGETAAGLGFSTADLEKTCNAFSGGWKTRIALAKLLLSSPDVLLLDEPTNHLDLETILWLESWIVASRCSVLLVSHERAFMDRLAGRVVELAGGEGMVYRGNYSSYLRQRGERREQLARAYENQQRKIKDIQNFIDRFRYNASKASLAQSRIKQLEAMERVPPPPPEQKTIHFEFPPAKRGNKEVAILKKASKSYGDHEVLAPFDLTLYRGERVALVGLNGAGKTTLTRILAGSLELTEGTRALGTAIELAHFDQFQDELLDSDRSVLAEMLSAAPSNRGDTARDILGAFLFVGEDVDKPVRVLSGGERTRLRLAKMLYSQANFLLLDEPTNHLDISSREALESALRRYEGALVLVSHDRVFLDRVVNKVIEIRDGQLHSYPGSFSDYLRATDGHGFLPESLTRGMGERSASGKAGEGARGGENGAMTEAEALIFKAEQTGLENLSKDERAAYRQARKTVGKERRRLEREAEQLENETHALELQLSELHARLADPAVATNPALLKELAQEEKSMRAAIKNKTAEWEAAAEALEED